MKCSIRQIWTCLHEDVRTLQISPSKPPQNSPKLPKLLQNSNLRPKFLVCFAIVRPSMTHKSPMLSMSPLLFPNLPKLNFRPKFLAFYYITMTYTGFLMSSISLQYCIVAFTTKSKPPLLQRFWKCGVKVGHPHESSILWEKESVVVPCPGYSLRQGE